MLWANASGAVLLGADTPAALAERNFAGDPLAAEIARIAATLPQVTEGQLIDVQMPLEVSHDVLWLPPAAIRTFQSRTFVVLQTPDGPRSVDVVLGLQTDDRVEIKSGVNEGDVVIGQ